ncbi:MAG: hypothetical protein WBA74_24200 [Cyclobacteriaceae bacterium]
MNIINQIFEIETKLQHNDTIGPVERNMQRIKNHLEEMGMSYHSPLNEKYTLDRTDCEASIAGDTTENNMYISKVIKPVIYQKNDGREEIIQRAIVIVES